MGAGPRAGGRWLRRGAGSRHWKLFPVSLNPGPRGTSELSRLAVSATTGPDPGHLLRPRPGRDVGAFFPLPGERPRGLAIAASAPRFLFAFLQAPGPPRLRSRRAGRRGPGGVAMAAEPGTWAPGGAPGPPRWADPPHGRARAVSLQGAPRWPGAARTAPLDVTPAPAAPPPRSRRRLAPPPAPRLSPPGSFPFQVPRRSAPHPSGASPLRGSWAGELRPPPRGRVVRAGGGPRSGLCLGLPGLVQSRAASLNDRADPGVFRDFAGALQPSPGEEGLEARARHARPVPR